MLNVPTLVRVSLAAVATVALVIIGSSCGDSSRRASGTHSTNVVVLTEANFQTEVISASMPVLVDFWAPWCGPCRTLGPIIDEIADDYRGRVKVGKVNVDEAPALAQRYGIQGIPTLLYFTNGRVVDQSLGILSKRDLSSRLDKLRPSTPAPATSSSQK